MKTFTHNGCRYELRHNADDDSRTLLRHAFPMEHAVFTINSDLEINTPDKKYLGALRSSRGIWWLRLPGGVAHEMGPLRNYDWQALLDAEIEAAHWLIDNHYITVADQK